MTKSLFPGMDPYLEPLWTDTRPALCVYIVDALRAVLPPGIIARIDCYQGSGFQPTESTDERLRDAFASDSDDTKPPESFVQLIDLRSQRRVLTVIEVMSVAAKCYSNNREIFRRVQLRRIKDGVNLVEIDLVRSGKWNLNAPLERVEARSRGTFHICVTRAAEPIKIGLYPVKLPDRLPRFHIPLGPADNDVILDLQPLLERAYERGSYGYDIDYTKPPVPPLSEADALWAKQWLASKLTD